MARGKPNPVAVAPPPVATVASGPPRLDDDAIWAAELNAAFTRLQADVRQRAQSVLGGELARMLGASGAVAAALGRPEAPALPPEPRGEPAAGRAARLAPAPPPPRSSPADDELAPAEPDPAATARSARGPRPAPEAPAGVTAVVRRRAGKLVTGDTPPASPGADPVEPPAAQLAFAGLAPEPDEMSDGDDAEENLADDAGQDEALDAAPGESQGGVLDDAQRERERRRDERREARMQRRQWRQERARQRRADARLRQAAKLTGNGPGPGMRFSDAPAYGADPALSDPGAPAREGSSAAAPDEPPAQAELALANDSSAPLEPDEVEPAQATDGRKRIRWTRESIITELASFLVSGTVIDASFIERYGPPGLVAATRRVFGRFDAALNVAGLHVAKLYPDGPPAR